LGRLQLYLGAHWRSRRRETAGSADRRGDGCDRDRRHAVHEGSFALSEQILAGGATAALAAIAVQIIVGGGAVRQLRNGTAEQSAARSRLAVAQRIAAGLLAITAICMGAARYA
jgi:hypothetical protein